MERLEHVCKLRTVVCNPGSTLEARVVLKPMPRRMSCGPADSNIEGGCGRKTHPRGHSKEGQDGGAGARELRPPQINGKG